MWASSVLGCLQGGRQRCIIKAVTVTAPLVCRPQGGHASYLSSLRTRMAAVDANRAGCVLYASLRCEHTSATAPQAEKELTVKERLDELMESFEEARELISEANESVGTTYFAEDIEDAVLQTEDVLKRWENLQGELEVQGAAEQLQKVRNMYALKIKQLEAELETVREAGGAG